MIALETLKGLNHGDIIFSKFKSVFDGKTYQFRTTLWHDKDGKLLYQCYGNYPAIHLDDEHIEYHLQNISLTPFDGIEIHIVPGLSVNATE